MMIPRIIKLIDATFPGAGSMGLGGENIGDHPETMRWDRDVSQWSGMCVYTDMGIVHYNKEPGAVNIGILIEPFELRYDVYQAALDVRNHFRAIFTHYRPFVELGPPFLFYPYCGSFIKDWDIFPKTKLVSMIVGFKALMSGHRLRHQIVGAFETGIDYYGHEGRFDPKYIALRDYGYSVVIENCVEDFYFSEKLIDCFSQGTIPIYWGCPSIGNFFDERGMCILDRETTLGSLFSILETISLEDYKSRKKYIDVNYRLAADYRCPEDWIMRRYPEVFE
jgi:hypothetical protein